MDFDKSKNIQKAAEMMGVLKYLFTHTRTLIYSAASCILTVILTFLTDTSLFLELFVIFFLLLMMIRIADDKYDYGSDRKKGKRQDLSEKGLLILYFVFAAFFIAIHLYIFDIPGLLSIFFVIYMILEEKLEILQRFFMFLLSCCYLFLLKGTIDINSAPVIAWLVISLILPMLFALHKRRKYK